MKTLFLGHFAATVAPDSRPRRVFACCNPWRTWLVSDLVKNNDPSLIDWFAESERRCGLRRPVIRCR
jgi:hypothetical protein